MSTRTSDERRQYGEYDIESMLGRGSIGKVYLARHRRIRRRVALKTIRFEQKFEDDLDAAEFYKRLQREAELCGALQHPNVVTLYEVGYENDVVSYLATEYIDGQSLLARLKRTRPLPLHEAVSIARDVLRGLAYAHGKGIIHRDIKPGNILLTAEGQAKIADFGIARPLNSSLTATNSLLGTPNYMSPEQVRSTPVTTRSDLFSAGVVLYEMLTGVKPFAAPELSGILFNVVNLNAPPVSEVNPSVPPELSAVVAKLLAKSPADRHASAADALAELEAVPLPPASEFGTMPAPPGHEATTPLRTFVDESFAAPPPAPPPPTLRRTVPAPLFWIVAVTLTGALTGSIVTLRNRIEREKPAAVMTPQQIATAAAKKRELRDARALVTVGKYEEALKRYDAYIARYPESDAARLERQSVQEALTASLKPSSEVTSTARARKTTKKADQPPPKPPSRWQRFKKWIRDGD